MPILLRLRVCRTFFICKSTTSKYLGEEELSEKEKAKLYKQKRARELITSVAGKR